MSRYFLAFLLIILSVTSCVEPPNFSTIPIISFKKIKVTPIPLGSTVTITLEFQDGDGDLGLDASDSTIFNYRFNFYLRNKDGNIIDVDDNVYKPVSEFIFLDNNGITYQIENNDSNYTLEQRNLINLLTEEKIPYINLKVEGRNFKDLKDNIYYLNTDTIYIDKHLNIFKKNIENNLIDIATGEIILSKDLESSGDNFLHIGTKMLYTVNEGNIFEDQADTFFILDSENNLIDLTDSGNIISFSDLSNIGDDGYFVAQNGSGKTFNYYNNNAYLDTLGNHYKIDVNSNLINLVTHEIIPSNNLSQDDNNKITDLNGTIYRPYNGNTYESNAQFFNMDALNNLTNIQTGEIVPSEKILNKNHYNYFITQKKKVGNLYVQVYKGLSNYRFLKLFLEDNVGGALEGELDLNLNIDYILGGSNSEIKKGDIMLFDIYIVDRNLNESNLITTTEVIIGE